jgi:putative ABC transport system permease protein
MNELFGVSMNLIAGIMFAVTAAIFVILAWLAVRNPIMFKNGLRNIPRRKTQTALIIFGLMLATVIMTAAFATGDTVASTVTDDVYDSTGEVDEFIRWNADDFPRPDDLQRIEFADIDRLDDIFADDPDIDALLPVIIETLPVLNSRTRLNESAVNVVGYDQRRAEAFGGLKDIHGDAVELTGNSIAVNESLVDAIDASVGDTLLVFFEGLPVEVTVVALVPDTLLGGAASMVTIGFPLNDDPGGAVSFAFLSEVLDREDADFVLVTNEGGIRSGLDRSDDVVESVEDALRGTTYEVVAMKKDILETAELVGSLFTTIFVIFGLFSIAAGVLLIFLIFIMLSAERKPEMGMARAIGAKRRHLVESFLAEGMGYDLGSAIVGVVLGIGVTFIMVAVVNSFAEAGLGLTLRVTFTLRSILVSFCIGVVVTFLIITIASVRASGLNIVSAIRDLPEPKPINPEAATWVGFYRGGLNAMVAAGYLVLGLMLLLILSGVWALLALPGLVIGVVGPFVYLLRSHNFSAPRQDRVEGERAPIWPFFIVPVVSSVGYAVAMLLVRVTRDRHPTSVPAWLIWVSALIAPLGLLLAALQDRKRRVPWAAGFGSVAAAVGALSIVLAYDTNRAFFFMLGVSLIFLSVALTLRYFHFAERLSFSVTSLLVLLAWYITPAGALDRLTGEMDGGIEMFFLSGIVMIASGTFLIVYNADIFLPVAERLGSRFSRIMPAVKTGVAYPLVSKLRTGLTISMIGLIMFALVVNSTLNTNFAAIFLGDEARGGFDVVSIVNSNNQIDSLEAALDEVGVSTDQIEATGETRVAFSSETEIRDPSPEMNDEGELVEFAGFLVMGGNSTFLTENTIELQRRAAGYDSDADAWAAVSEGENLAVINAGLTAPPPPFGPDHDVLNLEGLVLDRGFEPFEMDFRDPGTQRIVTVTVIGQMEDYADIFWPAVIVNQETLTEAFPDARGQVYYLRLDGSVDAGDFAKSVESGLVQASAESLGELLDDQRAASSGFLLLFQGFMGLGLVVGIAALGVISFRAVVERRQQIGMLRAIGYQRSMVALSFLFESSFVALSGILLGALLGLSFSWVLFTSGAIGTESEGAPFLVPWVSVVGISAIAFGASILMTVVPARSASRVAAAEALRYE